MMRTWFGVAAAAAVAVTIGVMAPEKALAFPSGLTAESLNEAAPALAESAQYRRRAYRPRIVCGVRYRRFYNGLFWSTAPVRVCWRRY